MARSAEDAAFAAAASGTQLTADQQAERTFLEAGTAVHPSAGTFPSLTLLSVPDWFADVVLSAGVHKEQCGFNSQIASNFAKWLCLLA